MPLEEGDPPPRAGLKIADEEFMDPFVAVDDDTIDDAESETYPD